MNTEIKPEAAAEEYANELTTPIERFIERKNSFLAGHAAAHRICATCLVEAHNEHADELRAELERWKRERAELAAALMEANVHADPYLGVCKERDRLHKELAEAREEKDLLSREVSTLNKCVADWNASYHEVSGKLAAANAAREKAEKERDSLSEMKTQTLERYLTNQQKKIIAERDSLSAELARVKDERDEATKENVVFRQIIRERTDSCPEDSVILNTAEMAVEALEKECADLRAKLAEAEDRLAQIRGMAEIRTEGGK